MAGKGRALGFLLAALITGGLAAEPVYTPTYVSLDYFGGEIGGGEWSYLGPDLYINGSDEFGTSFLPSTIQLNTPFVVSVPVLSVQGESTSGLNETKSYAGGMDITKIGLFGSAVLTGGPFIFAPDQYSESLPVTLMGTIYACDKSMYGIDCYRSDKDAALYINLNVLGVMTVDVGQGKYGSTVFASANFVSVPELPTAWMLVAGIIVLATFGTCTRSMLRAAR